jgi:hypothetical protein
MWKKIHDKRLEADSELLFIVAKDFGNGTWCLEFQAKDHYGDSNALVFFILVETLPETWEEVLELFVSELRRSLEKFLQ